MATGKELGSVIELMADCAAQSAVEVPHHRSMIGPVKWIRRHDKSTKHKSPEIVA